MQLTYYTIAQLVSKVDQQFLWESGLFQLPEEKQPLLSLFDKLRGARGPCQLAQHSASKELEVVDTLHLINMFVEGEVVSSFKSPEVNDQLLCLGGVNPPVILGVSLTPGCFNCMRSCPHVPKQSFFFSSVFLGIVSRIFASKRFHWKQLKFIFQAYRWRFKFTQNREEETEHEHKACTLYTNRP